jgi:hypothetical protein
MFSRRFVAAGGVVILILIAAACGGSAPATQVAVLGSAPFPSGQPPATSGPATVASPLATAASVPVTPVTVTPVTVTPVITDSPPCGHITEPPFSGYIPPNTSGPPVGTGIKDWTPEQVVYAFIRAVNANDTSTAEGLITGTKRNPWMGGGDDPTLRSGVCVSNLRIDAATWLSIGPGSPATGYPEAVDVPAQFTVEQTSPGAIPNGYTSWNFLLVWHADAPWMIIDEGPA